MLAGSNQLCPFAIEQWPHTALSLQAEKKCTSTQGLCAVQVALPGQQAFRRAQHHEIHPTLAELSPRHQAHLVSQQQSNNVCRAASQPQGRVPSTHTPEISQPPWPLPGADLCCRGGAKLSRSTSTQVWACRMSLGPTLARWAPSRCEHPDRFSIHDESLTSIQAGGRCWTGTCRLEATPQAQGAHP